MTLRAQSYLPGDSRKITTLSGFHASLTMWSDVYLEDKDNFKRRFNFDVLAPFPNLHAPLFNIVCDLISTHSLSYASQVFASWKGTLQAIGPNSEDLSLEILSVFKREIDPPPITYRPFIQASLHRWIDLKYPGLDDSLVDFLNGPERWEESGDGAYFALIANDPCRGALTQQELDDLADAANAALVAGRLSKDDHTLVWMFIALGIRPIQLHRMTPDHVIATTGPEGTEITLLIPLAKGEGQSDQGHWRRRAPSLLADCLVPYMQRTNFSGHPDGRLFRFSTSNQITNHFCRLFQEEILTWSDRLEAPIPMFPYRLRYTMGTRAIAQGASDHEVARLLTHRKITSIRFYRASMPLLQRPIKEAIGKEMSYIARAFKGRLISDLDEATRRGDSDAVIRDFLRLSGAKLGACGTMEKCYLNAPIACLSCPFFEPLRGAPWTALKEKILADRMQELEPKIREINDKALSALEIIMQLEVVQS